MCPKWALAKRKTTLIGEEIFTLFKNFARFNVLSLEFEDLNV